MPRISAHGFRATGLTLLALWLVLCLAGIACWWQWGHEGFNGASFAQAARNTLRFGMLGPFLWHSELTPPDPTSAYAHHPLIIHLHSVLAQWITGSEAPWVFRLTPALYSFGTLVVLFDLARRSGGRAYALLTGALFVSFPGMSIFSGTVIHEQGTVFWILVGVWAELRYVATRRGSFRVAAVLSLFLALNFGWAAYFAAFFLFLHALFRAFAHRHHPVGRRRALAFALGLVGVVAASVLLFLAWAAWAKGGLSELVRTFVWRSGGSNTSRFSPSVAPIQLLYGWVPAVLYALFLPTLALRSVRRRPEAMVALLFVLTQLVHSTVFRQAARIHAYWEYYAAPGIALGAALFLLTLYRWGRRSPRLRPWTRSALILSALALLAVQLPYSVKQRRFGIETAGLSGPGGSRAWHLEARWLENVAERFPHGSARFHFIQTLEDRPEIRHILDGPLTFQRRAGFSAQSSTPPEQVPTVLLADLESVRSPGSRLRLERLAAARGIIWDDRFIAVELGQQRSAPVRLRSQQREGGLLFRWFVHPTAPKLQWVESQH